MTITWILSSTEGIVKTYLVIPSRWQDLVLRIPTQLPGRRPISPDAAMTSMGWHGDLSFPFHDRQVRRRTVEQQNHTRKELRRGVNLFFLRLQRVQERN